MYEPLLIRRCSCRFSCYLFRHHQQISLLRSLQTAALIRADGTSVSEHLILIGRLGTEWYGERRNRFSLMSAAAPSQRSTRSDWASTYAASAPSENRRRPAIASVLYPGTLQPLDIYPERLPRIHQTRGTLHLVLQSSRSHVTPVSPEYIGRLVQGIDRFVHPKTLTTRGPVYLGQCLPEAQRTVTHRQPILFSSSSAARTSSALNPCSNQR